MKTAAVMGEVAVLSALPVGGSARWPRAALIAPQAAWVLGADVGTALLRLLLGIVLVRSLSPGVFGQYVYVLAVLTFIKGLALPGLSKALQRAVAVGSAGSFRTAVWAKLRHAALGAVLLGGCGLYYGLQGMPTVALAFLAVAGWFIPDQLVELSRSVFIGRQQLVRLFAYLLSEQSATVAITNLVAIQTHSLWAIVFSLLGTSVCMRAVWFVDLCLRHPTRGPADEQLVSDSRQLTAMGGLAVAASQVAKVMLAHTLSFAELAIYGVATMAVGRIQGLSGSVLVGLMPRLAQTDVPESFQLLRRVARPLSVWFGGVSAGCALLAPWVIPGLFGVQYQRAVPYLQILCLAVFCELLSGVLTKGLFLAHRRMDALWRSTLLWSLGQVLLYTVSIPLWGLPGAVAATVMASVVHLVYVYRLAKRLEDGAAPHSSVPSHLPA